jgi:1-acyl-sn-glycerol-3-phosphate acyltransferase
MRAQQEPGGDDLGEGGGPAASVEGSQVRAQGAMERAVAELCGELSPNPSAVPAPDAVLADLGFDSLAVGDLSAALEERFGVRLADDAIEAMRTVSEVAATVRSRMPARQRIPPGIGRLQQPGKAIAGWAFRWQARLKVEGAEHVPATGPVLVASNHRSMLDVPLLVIACPRPVTFMAKRELFGDPLRRWMFHVLGGFPVRREIADVRAMDIGLAVLERGDVLGLYPEGKRTKSTTMAPFLKGAAWMALKVGAPIVPCGIVGTERPGKRPQLRKRVRITFGPAIQVERVDEPRRRRERAEEVTAQLLEGISALVR